MATVNLTDENFEAEVIKAGKPVIVDFWAEWCGPCKQIAPTLEEISNEMANDVVIAKHNIDNEPNTPTKYGIRGIPTMLLFSGGELKATKVGPICLHGPHHSAQKSTIIGLSDFKTSVSKFSSVIFTVVIINSIYLLN